LVVLHHAKFDLKMLGSLTGDRETLAKARVADTMLAEQVLRNGRSAAAQIPSVGLAALAQRYAGMELDKTVREGFISARSAEELGEAELAYARRDVEATWKVFAAQLPQIAQDGLLRAVAIEGASAWAFAEMELRGMPIDVGAWRKVIAHASAGKTAARAALDREVKDVVDRDLFGNTSINYESDQEVLAALQRLGVSLESTRREVLLATEHPAALALVSYREHQKIVSTYGERFLEHVHSTTGRIHSTFKPVGAITGRAASAEPNLQNIPHGSEFRESFRAPEGRKLITADYSGAELRILAQVSADPVFIQTFHEGGDLHAIVASRMFNKPVSKTENPELRARAKAINFGLCYGMGAQGLANQIGLSVQDAEVLLERYFRAYPAIREYLERSAREALRRGWSETLSGRRYWFNDLFRASADEASRVRVAKNMPIQGTNADMTKMAMARIARSLAERRLDGFLVNMVHDELVIDASDGDAEAVREVVVEQMRAAGSEFVKRVPIEVDAKISDVWEK
jgi:DNA polymerase-1